MYAFTYSYMNAHLCDQFHSDVRVNIIIVNINIRNTSCTFIYNTFIRNITNKLN